MSQGATRHCDVSRHACRARLGDRGRVRRTTGDETEEVSPKKQHRSGAILNTLLPGETGSASIKEVWKVHKPAQTEFHCICFEVDLSAAAGFSRLY